LNEIVVINADDWEVLYVNGENKYEHHHVTLEEIADYVPIKSIKRYGLTNQEAYDWFMGEGTFPATLAEIPKEYYE
jgi:hypothetical protein